MALRHALRWGVATLLTTLSAAAIANDWSFEDGTLRGWTATGPAFAAQPTYGNNVEPRRPGESPGQVGRYWIGTYERHPSPTTPFGDVVGDEPQGTLTSDPFTIETLRVDFLIGGGNDIEHERVSLLVKVQPGDPPPGRPGMVVRMPDGDYLTLRSETGGNEEHMRPGGWNVSTLLHRTARIQIVDTASGPWGHINVDNFRGIDEVDPTEPDLPPDPNGPASGLGTAVPVSGLGTAVPVQQGQPARAYAVGGGAVSVAPLAAQPATARAVGGGNITVAPPAATAVGNEVTVPVVQRDPPPPPDPATSGHFQLIALEFVVNHQTRDDALENDGPGDEIMVRSDNLTFAPDGRFVTREKIKSGIFGSPDHSDFVAGSAVPGFSARADVGGLKSGDIYPMRPRPVRTNGDLPMVLWDGVLERGGNDVLIVPSVWEVEDRSTSDAERGWEVGMTRSQTLGQSVVILASSLVEDNTPPVVPNFLQGIPAFDRGNRPIGAATTPARFPAGALPHWRGMDAPAIPLNFDRAVYFAARHATAVSLSREPGMLVSDALPVPRGGIIVELIDPAGNDGNYWLVLQLVRVD